MEVSSPVTSLTVYSVLKFGFELEQSVFRSFGLPVGVHPPTAYRVPLGPKAMAMTASPGTGTPNRVASPVFVSKLVSCWFPKSGPHMLISVPEGDIASAAQPLFLVGPMSVVVIFPPVTSIAHSSPAPVEKARV